MKTRLVSALLLVLVLGIGLAATAAPGGTSPVDGRRAYSAGFVDLKSRLDRGQLAAIHDRLLELHRQGADREAICRERFRMLREYGVPVPGGLEEKCLRAMKRAFRGRPSVLSPEQRREIDGLVLSLRENGADRREIHRAVRQKLKEFGVKPPPHRRPGGGLGRLMARLEKEQRSLFRARMRDLRRCGTDRREILRELGDLLVSWGIEPPAWMQPFQEPREPEPAEGREATAAAVGEAETEVHDFNLGNYPNPFNPDTRITFSLPEPADVLLDIYNLRGERVRRLLSGPSEAGTHSVTWDGRTEDGRTAGSGVYICHLQAGKRTLTRQMLLLK